MYTKERRKAREDFAKKVAPWRVKYQIGARGKKVDDDWLAIDLYDKSDLIDHRWDLQNLPILDNSADCYLCNAVLEHIPRPDLALFEMFRTLRPGGQIWVEVPFLQFYHAHPNDFTRWTLPGIRLQMNEFEEISSGISTSFDYEAGKMFEFLSTDIGEQVDLMEKERIIKCVREKLKRNSNPRVYGTVFYCGEKRGTLMAPEKVQYFEYLKKCL